MAAEKTQYDRVGVNLSICQRWVMLTAHKSRLKSMLVMLNKHKGSLVCRSMPGEENC